MSNGMIRRTLRIHRYMPEALAAMETSILIWIISQADRGNQSYVLLSIHPDQQGAGLDDVDEVMMKVTVMTQHTRRITSPSSLDRLPPADRIVFQHRLRDVFVSSRPDYPDDCVRSTSAYLAEE